MSFNTTGIIKTRSRHTYAIIEVHDRDDGSRNTVIIGYGDIPERTDARVAQYNGTYGGPKLKYKKKIIEDRPGVKYRVVTLVDGE